MADTLEEFKKPIEEWAPARAFKETDMAASALAVKILSLEVRSPKPDLQGTFQMALKKVRVHL